MRRVFKIGEVVWYEDDHESGWGKIVLINRSDSIKEDICSDEDGDIITIQKDGCESEIETTPSRVYQVAPGRSYCGQPVVWEHERLGYPFYCPAWSENVFHCELD